MQIFHWLFKAAKEGTIAEYHSCSAPTKGNVNDYKEDTHIVVSSDQHRRSHRRSERVRLRKSGLKIFSPLAVLCRRDVAKACFYSTIHLKSVNDLHSKQHQVRCTRKMKKEDADHGAQQGTTTKVESTAHVGSKVLPVSETAISSSTSSGDQCGTLVKTGNKVKGDKTKTMSRMKELLRWAAAAKSERGGKFMGRKVLQFPNRATLKTLPDDDQLSLESPKISFRWEAESCSTPSSVCSNMSLASSSRIDHKYPNTLSLNSTPAHGRKGNWITTDSEFVVLELEL